MKGRLVVGLRGGSWYSRPTFTLATDKLYNGPVWRAGSVGFRCVQRVVPHLVGLRGGSWFGASGPASDLGFYRSDGAGDNVGFRCCVRREA